MLIHKPFDTSTLDQIFQHINSGLTPNGPWIAGGAPLSIADGFHRLYPQSDIDVFGSKRDILALKERMRLQTEGVVLGKMYIAHCGVQYDRRIQLIESPFTDPISLLHDFDFTVSQFIATRSGIYGTELAWSDLKDRQLRVMGKSRNTFNRLQKYIERGFTPAPGTLTTIVKDTFTPYKFDIGKMRLLDAKGY